MTVIAELDALVVRAGASRTRLAAFVRDVPAEEWDWSPEDGTPSPRELVAALLVDEEARRARFVDGVRSERGPRGASARHDVETPAAAARTLSAVRAATTATLAAAPDDRREEAEALLLSLVFGDGAAFGYVSLILRLIDPLRASPAFY